MLKKFTVKLLILLFVFAGSLITGCFEEPIIAPVGAPYSSIRVGNFSYNVPEINVYVDGELKSTLNNNEIPNVNFDLPSGERKFKIIDGAGSTVFDKNLTINSYDELSILFTGFYAPGVDTLHSFGPYQLTDGAVYLPENPAAGFTRMIFSNVSPPTLVENSKIYGIILSTPTTRDTTEADDFMAFNKGITVNMKAGEYTVSVVYDNLDTVEEGDLVTVLDSTITFSEGMREYVFVTGDPSSPIIVRDTRAPLPVRPK